MRDLLFIMSKSKFCTAKLKHTFFDHTEISISCTLLFLRLLEILKIESVSNLLKYVFEILLSNSSESTTKFLIRAWYKSSRIATFAGVRADLATVWMVLPFHLRVEALVPLIDLFKSFSSSFLYNNSIPVLMKVESLCFSPGINLNFRRKTG